MPGVNLNLLVYLPSTPPAVDKNYFKKILSLREEEGPRTGRSDTSRNNSTPMLMAKRSQIDTHIYNTYGCIQCKTHQDVYLNWNLRRDLPPPRSSNGLRRKGSKRPDMGLWTDSPDIVVNQPIVVNILLIMIILILTCNFLLINLF